MYRFLLFFIFISLLLPSTTAANNRTPSTTVQQWQNLIDRNEKIMALDDMVLRNYQITQSYYEIGILFQSLVGTSMEEGNSPACDWPTVATWASNSVGMSIRRQTLPDWVWMNLHDSLPNWLITLLDFFPDLIDYVFSTMLETASDFLGKGNKMVFGQVGGFMCSFGLYFANLTSPDQARWNKFVSTFNTSDNIEAFLHKAAQGYYNAMWTTGKAKAEWMLYGNMYVGLAEQTRLQPCIYGAMQNNKTIEFNLPGFGKISINEASVITEMLITLVFSNEILYAGDNVTPRPWDGKDWPANLVTIDNPLVRQTYIQLVGQTTSFNNTAASNWVDLSQRMRFVVPFFRSRQDDIQLVSCPPFSEQQVAQIWSGIKPNSKNLCIANCCQSS